jgi:carbon monoxide dehydrogenase subunit G
VVTEGRDRVLNSAVRTTQTFELHDWGDECEVTIGATINVSGRIATFGHRVILSKAEQVTVEALDNISALLERRRGTSPA